MASRRFLRKKGLHIHAKVVEPVKSAVDRVPKPEGYELVERVLPEDYPVHCGYCYVADGRVISSDVSGTVANLRRNLQASEIKNCDMVGRDLF
jgi:hypothetical protein